MIRRLTKGLFPLLMLVAVLGCNKDLGALELSVKAKALWEKGNHDDAARTFITLSELYPESPLAEESLFWAANLYQYFIKDQDQAIRYYRQMLVQYPNGNLTAETRENLALLYEENKTTQHRALQIYREMILDKNLSNRWDHFQFKAARLNMKMGKLDHARFDLRTLMTKYPKSPLIPQAYYMAGYTYYLEKRYPLALVAFRQVIKDFPAKPIAAQARFFMADTLEEQGKLRSALRDFRKLRGKYHNQKILEKRIKALQTRIRKGVQ